MSAVRTYENSERPDGWRKVRLGDVVEINQRNWDPRDGAPILYLDLTAVIAPGRLDEPKELAASDAPSRARRRVLSGDILVSTVRPNLRGFARVQKAAGNLVASTGFAVLTPSTEVEGSFVYHHVMTEQFAARLEAAATGQAYPAVRPDDVNNYSITLPPLPEQRAIADVLDSIDEAIEHTEAVIAATETLRDSLLHELLTRGVPGWHTEWKDVPGMSTIPADWQVVLLADVATVDRGKFAHRPRNEPRFYGGDTPFIQTSDVVRSVGVIRSHSQTLNESGLSISKLFPTGTVVITIAANIGETAITGYPMAFPDSLVGMIPTGVDSRFLEYYVRTQKARLERFAPESAQKNINLEDLRPMLVPVPSKDEQTAIAKQLGAVQYEVDSLQALLADTRTLKTSMANELLSGRACTQTTR